MDLAQLTIDLRDWFRIEGAGVYRLSYARCLEDGRIHIAAPSQFVIEDDAAVEKLAAALDAGPARDTFTALLKDNPVFTADGVPKTYGDDGMHWRDRPQMLQGKWDEPIQAVRQKWSDGIDLLTEKDRPAGHGRALDALIDRLLRLSDGFRADPWNDFIMHLDVRVMNNLPRKEQEQLHLTGRDAVSQAPEPAGGRTGTDDRRRDPAGEAPVTS